MITFVLRRDTGEVARFLDRALRIGLGLAVAGAVVWATFSETLACSDASPHVCGPDAVGSVAIGALLAVPLLLWFLPTFAAVVLLGFAWADVRYDPTVEAHGPFVTVGVAAAVVALLHLRLRRTADSATPAVPVQHSRDVAWSALTWLAATLALVAAAAAVTWYGVHLQREDARHRARAERVVGVVTRHDITDDEDTVLVVRGPDGHEFRFSVVEFEPYPVGLTTAVDVDPLDPAWSELVAEGHDPTWTFLLASTAAVVSLGTGVRAVEAGLPRHRRVRLGERELRPASQRNVRVQSALTTLGAVAAGPVGMWFADSWPERLTAGAGAANAAVLGTGRWYRGVRADPEQLQLRTTLWRHDLAWPAVTGIQVLGAEVLVGDDRGDVHRFGPFDPEPDVGVLATSTLVAQRLEAWRAAAGTGRRATRPSRRRLGPAAFVGAGVVALEIVTELVLVA